ncbi:MAG: Flp family type IVb pilin [Hyphomicrobiaceae bacterium]|nr:Flp family type IVb pilin [Hyphomicrobiaceae bacterium]
MVTRLNKELARLARDERGASLLEYTILLAIITVGAIASIGSVGTWVSTKWSTLNTKLGTP